MPKHDCNHIDAAGKPCEAPAKHGKDVCWFHDMSPDGVADRRAAEKKSIEKRTKMALRQLEDTEPTITPEMLVRQMQAALASVDKLPDGSAKLKQQVDLFSSLTRALELKEKSAPSGPAEVRIVYVNNWDGSPSDESSRTDSRS